MAMAQPAGPGRSAGLAAAANPQGSPAAVMRFAIDEPRLRSAPAWRCRGLLAMGLLAGLLALGAVRPAAAQGKLDAHYEASLAGIPVGKGAWTIEIADDQYNAAASGGTSGLLKAFAGGSGTGAATGRIVAGSLVPSNYTATTTASKKSETIRMALQGGGVKESSI
jgi:hypothetical protein